MVGLNNLKRNKMKNIHALPTDKPSRLIIYSTLLNEFRLLKEPYEDWKHKRHIYITSDEEIKKGDWYITVLNNEIYKADIDTEIIMSIANKYDNTTYKKTHFKIILSTDQDLIKDGVQAIDENFLEWFVKNQTCESVEINEKSVDDIEKELGIHGHDQGLSERELKEWLRNGGQLYEVIIPKEEPKQEYNNLNYGGGFTEEDIKRVSEKNTSQETLEEAAEKYAEENARDQNISYHNLYAPLEYAFRNGAKWQAKRMYSEEELLNLLPKFAAYTLLNADEASRLSLDEWFKQFKKK